MYVVMEGASSLAPGPRRRLGRLWCLRLLTTLRFG
jgi:hypothetical protein